MSSSSATSTAFWCRNCCLCFHHHRRNRCPSCHANLLQDFSSNLESDDFPFTFSSTTVFHRDSLNIFMFYPVNIDHEEESEIEEEEEEDIEEWLSFRSHPSPHSPHSIQHPIHEELDQGEWGSNPTLKAAIDKMPKLRYSARDKDNINNTNDVCAVCKEFFEEGEELMQMPCKHVYHSHCILPWLNHHCTCPLCRKPISISTSSSSSLALLQAHSSTPIVTPQSSNSPIECDRRVEEEEEEEGMAIGSLEEGSSSCSSVTLGGRRLICCFPFHLWLFGFPSPT